MGEHVVQLGCDPLALRLRRSRRCVRSIDESAFGLRTRMALAIERFAKNPAQHPRPGGDDQPEQHARLEIREPFERCVDNSEREQDCRQSHRSSRP